jgi:hypothetical protein
MNRLRATIIARHEWGKSPVVDRIGIAAPIASMIYSLEKSRKWKRPRLWPRTSTHNLERAAIVPPASPMSRRLCSNLAVAAFEQEPAASSLFGCGISAPVARRRSTPVSSLKPSRRAVFNSLPHESETPKMCLQSICRKCKKPAGMNWKLDYGPGYLTARNTSRTGLDGERSISFHQTSHGCGPRLRNFPTLNRSDYEMNENRLCHETFF